jgi:hypothetical protein
MRVHSDRLRKDLKNLKIGSETRERLTEEINLLYDEIQSVSGPLATDGGVLANDIYGNLPQLGWERLTRLFLK